VNCKHKGRRANCPDSGFFNYRQIAGFTLLEILLAVVILAIVMTSVYGTWNAALNGWKRGTAVADTLQRQRVVMDTLAELARSAVFFGPNIADYQITGVHNEFEGDTVSFVTASDVLLLPSETAFAGMRRVTLGLHRGESGRPVLAIANSPVLGDQEETGTFHVLSADVVLFKVRYRDPRNESWKEGWNEEKSIPLAIEFTVGFIGDSGVNDDPVIVTRAIDLPSSTYAMQTIGQQVNQRNTTNTVTRPGYVNLVEPTTPGGAGGGATGGRK
jgi:prepilin-type N-terminal cleavage/methylation domain-containing protein